MHTNLTWKDGVVLTLIGIVCAIGILSCAGIAPGPDDPDLAVRDTHAYYVETEARLEQELQDMQFSGAPQEMLIAKQAELRALREEFVAWERSIVKERLGPVGAIVGSIHPALLPVAAFGVNLAAGLMTKRGRKHAKQALKDFSPWRNQDGTEFRPWDGVKSIARANGWLHSSRESEEADEAADAKKKATPAASGASPT